MSIVFLGLPTVTEAMIEAAHKKAWAARQAYIDAQGTAYIDAARHVFNGAGYVHYTLIALSQAQKCVRHAGEQNYTDQLLAALGLGPEGEA